MSNISRPTSFVDDATAVQNTRSAIVAKLRGLPRVDGVMGREIAGSDPTVRSVVGAAPVTGQPVTMVQALESATAALGVNLTALLDSERFVRALGSIDAGDAQAITSTITDAVAVNPSLAPTRPVMAPNRAQGSSASGVIRAAPKTLNDRIKERLGNLPEVDKLGIPLN